MGLVKKDCPTCHGEKTLPCSCGKGYYETTRTREDADGRLIYETERNTCTFCGGSARYQCPACGGEGYVLMPGDPDNDENVEPDPHDPEVPTTPAEFASEARLNLKEAERKREQLMEWVSNAYDDFDTKFRSEFNSWLSDFDLSDLRTAGALEAWADREDVPGRSTKFGTLLLQVRSLADQVRRVDFYRSLGGQTS